MVVATLYGADPKIWETTIVRIDLKVSGYKTIFDIIYFSFFFLITDQIWKPSNWLKVSSTERLLRKI